MNPIRDRESPLLATLALCACLAHGHASAQSVTATDLGGGCGGTIGYPALLSSGWFAFRVQRAVCDPNAVSWPSVLAIGGPLPPLHVPFGPGQAPGCTWLVAPLATLPIPTTVGGQGATVFVIDVASIPVPITVHVQAFATCLVQGSRESAASDAWRVDFR
ncbi:MAG: hypothetical protein IPM29_20360 [Planctomycetes bacterium]|nr:hypothetical protein [Planctomycetota bacterium]